MVTREGGGSKNLIFAVMSFLNGPYMCDLTCCSYPWHDLTRQLWFENELNSCDVYELLYRVAERGFFDFAAHVFVQVESLVRRSVFSFLETAQCTVRWSPPMSVWKHDELIMNFVTMVQTGKRVRTRTLNTIEVISRVQIISAVQKI